MTHEIITFEKLSHGMFVEVDSVARQPQKAGEPPRYRITCHPTADREVARVTVLVTEERAKQLGLIH